MTRVGLSGDILDEENEPFRNQISLKVAGNLRGARLDLEQSFVVWDNCSVWYSSDAGMNLPGEFEVVKFSNKIKIFNTFQEIRSPDL